MSDIDPTGTDWSEAEIKIVISQYFSMLAHEIANEPYIKAQHNRFVQEATGRSKGSIEFKFQNISAVLNKLSFPWIAGYKPMSNYQGALLGAIESAFKNQRGLLGIFETQIQRGFSEEKALYIEAPPQAQHTDVIKNETLERLVKKFDPAARDARNRALGHKGEELVYQYECARLGSERPDLARKVRWVSEEDGDGAGYDILSFDLAGKERLIEVKTTIGHQTTPFYISSNEFELSQERPDQFCLMRVFDFLKLPRAFELQPPLSESLILRTQSYRAAFQ